MAGIEPLEFTPPDGWLARPTRRGLNPYNLDEPAVAAAPPRAADGNGRGAQAAARGMGFPPMKHTAKLAVPRLSTASNDRLSLPTVGNDHGETESAKCGKFAE